MYKTHDVTWRHHDLYWHNNTDLNEKMKDLDMQINQFKSQIKMSDNLTEETQAGDVMDIREEYHSEEVSCRHVVLTYWMWQEEEDSRKFPGLEHLKRVGESDDIDDEKEKERDDYMQRLLELVCTIVALFKTKFYQLFRLHKNVKILWIKRSCDKYFSELKILILLQEEEEERANAEGIYDEEVSIFSSKFHIT